MPFKTHPVKYGFIPNIFVTYGIEKGGVFIRKRSRWGYSLGDQVVRVENVTREWAEGRFLGDVHFGEGSHTPIIWRSVSSPQQVLHSARAAIKHEAEQADLATQPPSRLEQARTTGRTGFGDHKDIKPNDTDPKDVPGTHWTINGDGTVTNHRQKLMWIQGCWGQTWDGERFTGDAVPLSWDDATPLFGKGVFAYPERERSSEDPATWSDADITHGYERGSCTVTFAGHSDWRLPTVSEACQLDSSAVSEDDLYLIYQVFPQDRVEGFITANGKDTYFNPFKLRRCAALVWKGRRGMCPNDENPTYPYPIIFCRSI